MLKEFREFAMRGSVLDLAIGIVIGAAFGAVVNSFVKDVLMPPIGLLLGRVEFSSLLVTLTTGPEGSVAIRYGLFVNNIISFVIVAFAIFLVVKSINRMRRSAEKPPDTKDCPHCLSTIPIKATRCAYCTSQV